jgi:hypothetical protein
MDEAISIIRRDINLLGMQIPGRICVTRAADIAPNSR